VDPLDALPRAAALLALLALLPAALGALIRWSFVDPSGAVAPETPEAWARLGLLPGLLVGAFLIGLTLLPPTLADGPLHPARLATALMTSAVAGVFSIPRRLLRALRARAANERSVGLGRFGPLAVGALFGLGLPLVLVTATHVTALSGSIRSEAAGEDAARRLFFVPWDPDAHLALGWRATLAGDGEIAARHLAFAERVSTTNAEQLELRAELEAQRGACDAARRTFAEALDRRTARAMAEVLEAPLELTDYALPPSLVRVCGLASEPLSDP
jgi:hypothetical protein